MFHIMSEHQLTRKYVQQFGIALKLRLETTFHLKLREDMTSLKIRIVLFWLMILKPRNCL